MELDLLQFDPCWLFTGSDAFKVTVLPYSVKDTLQLCVFLSRSKGEESIYKASRELVPH